MFTLQKYNPQQGIRLLFCHILTVGATKKSLLKTKANRTFLNFAKRNNAILLQMEPGLYYLCKYTYNKMMQ